MRLLAAFVIAHAVLVLSGCGAVRPTVAAPVPTAGPSIDTASPAKAERLDVDTPRTTVAGNTFVAPAGWSIAVRGAATLLEAPEEGSFIAIVDVRATDADAAVAAAWSAYKPGAQWPLKAVTPVADRDGWTNRSTYNYQTSPNERRDVDVDVRRASDIWTVSIVRHGPGRR